MVWTSLTAVVGASVVVGGGAMLNVGSAEPAAVSAAFSKTSEWETGYTGRYVVTNNTQETQPNWTLEFDVPQGAQITAVRDAPWAMNGQRPTGKPPQWDGGALVAGEGDPSWTTNGQHLTVKPPQWDADGLAAGESMTVGFVVHGTAGDPTNCSIDGSPCLGEGGGQPEQTGSTAPPQPSPTVTAPPTTQPPESAGPAPTAPPDTVAQVVALVNKERAAAGCGPLTEDAQLEKAAQDHSDDMAARNFFDHTNPDGADPGQRISAAGYRWSTYGENIAQGQQSPQDVMDSWMNSSGHRANILNCSFKDIGVGVHTGSGGPWWTQDFGARA